MAEERGLLSAIASRLKFKFSNAKEPSYEQSRIRLWEWTNTIKQTTFWQSDIFSDLIPGMRRDLSKIEIEDIIIDRLRQRFGSEDSDAVLFDKLSHHNHLEEKEKIRFAQRMINIFNPDGVVKITKTTFEDPSIVELCDKHKDLILQGAYHDHSMAFSEGLFHINQLYKNENIKVPFDFTKKLAEAMTSSEAFTTFFKNKQRDLEKYGREGRHAETLLMDMIESGSNTEEKRAIKSIFQNVRNFAFADALYNEMKFVENRDNISLDPAIYDSLCQ